MEAAEFMDRVKSGRQRMIPLDYEQIGAVTAEVCAKRASLADLKIFNYARKRSWSTLWSENRSS
jgi:hypothetical protein